MSVNTAHANNGVLIHSGECENVTMEFSGQDGSLFKGSKQGRIYLTTHRMIFNASKSSDPLQSFSFPFVAMSEVEIEQPAFSSNYIKGKIRAQPNGNWTGEAKFKLYFKSGGAIDFGQAMLRAARMAQRNATSDSPPPYTPPTGAWYEAPPPAYAPNPQGYYGWVPSTQAFPNQPPSNTVFMTDNPPPYPGIIQTPGNYQNGYPNAGFQGQPQNTGFAPGPAPGAGYPPGPGAGYSPGPGAGFPPGTGVGYPGGGPGAGYPPGPGVGYPGGGPGAGYPGAGYPTMGGPGGYPQMGGPGGYPPNQRPGYSNPQMGFQGYGAGAPNQGGNLPGYQGGLGQPGFPAGGMGFSSAPPPNSKEAEAAQSAYYDPNQPQTAYVPPPAYYEPPPSYNSLANKKDQ